MICVTPSILVATVGLVAYAVCRAQRFQSQGCHCSAYEPEVQTDQCNSGHWWMVGLRTKSGLFFDTRGTAPSLNSPMCFSIEKMFSYAIDSKLCHLNLFWGFFFFFLAKTEYQEGRSFPPEFHNGNLVLPPHPPRHPLSATPHPPPPET